MKIRASCKSCIKPPGGRAYFVSGPKKVGRGEGFLERAFYGEWSLIFTVKSYIFNEICNSFPNFTVYTCPVTKTEQEIEGVCAIRP